MSHRWALVERGESLRWRCERCELECTTHATAITPRSGHDGIRVGGTYARRLPTCGEAEPRRYPHRHVWRVGSTASDRAFWSCLRCGIEVETSISVTHPSGNERGLRFVRRAGDSWVRLTARLPACEALL